MTRDAAAGRGSPFEPGSDQAALWKEEEAILYHQTRTFRCAEILKQIQAVERIAKSRRTLLCSAVIGPVRWVATLKNGRSKK